MAHETTHRIYTPERTYHVELVRERDPAYSSWSEYRDSEGDRWWEHVDGRVTNADGDEVEGARLEKLDA